MKETFYFAHDYNASQDPKILNMFSELKAEGYGLYWMLIEKLAEANGKLLLTDLKGLAFAWQTEGSKLVLLVETFSLFDSDGTHFWSNRLLDHLKKRSKISQTRAKIGRIGGKANAKQLLSKGEANEKQNEAKESKVKESKIKDIDTPPILEDVKAYCQERANGVDADKWFNFYSAKGWMIGKNKMKDWKAAVRTWEEKKKKDYSAMSDFSLMEEKIKMQDNRKNGKVEDTTELVKELTKRFQ